MVIPYSLSFTHPEGRYVQTSPLSHVPLQWSPTQLLDDMLSREVYGNTIHVEQPQEEASRQYSVEWTLSDNTRDVYPGDRVTERYVDAATGPNYGFTFVLVQD